MSDLGELSESDDEDDEEIIEGLQKYPGYPRDYWGKITQRGEIKYPDNVVYIFEDTQVWSHDIRTGMFKVIGGVGVVQQMRERVGDPGFFDYKKFFLSSWFWYIVSFFNNKL